MTFKAWVLFILSFTVGYYFSFRPMPKVRIPAAVRKSYDFSQMQGDDFLRASKERLISDARMVHTQEGVGISLGAFQMRTAMGVKGHVCQEFSNVIFQFTASNGTSEENTTSRMEVEGPCMAQVGRDQLQALMIPVQKIIGQVPADGEFQFRQQGMLSVRFDNVGERWPKEWTLQSIVLKSAQSQHQLTIQPHEMKGYLANPIQVRFE